MAAIPSRSVPECKVCTMISRSEKLGALFYAYRFNENFTLRALAQAMARHIEEWNAVNPDKLVVTFSFKSASIHLNKHTPADLQMKYQLQTEQHAARDTRAQKSVSVAVQRHMADQIAKNVSTFEEMTLLFTNLKSLYERYEDRKPDISEISVHLPILREMRATLESIAKMKQSKELIRIAVRSVIDTFLNVFVDEAGREVNKLRDQVARKTDAQFADRVMSDFRKVLVDVVIESSRVAVNRVKNEFALDEARGEVV